MSGVPADFRKRFVAGEQLCGSFIKTPTSHAIEILGDLGYDFVVIDEEHAPFERASIDVCLLAAKAAGTAGVVRVAAPTASNLLSVLDNGATGVLVPHVNSVAKAKEIVSACRYRGGKRGFAASTRAGRYGGATMAQHIADQDKTVTVIAMIEDPEALDEIDAIVAVDGLDGFFIGRGDLTVAFQAPNADAPAVKDAVVKIIAAAKKVGKPICVMVNSAAEAKPFREQGASAFIVSTDQGFLRKAASQALTEMAALKS
jgi:2-keto-3-deoxy-L-rhamnonate aldolase RhmA